MLCNTIQSTFTRLDRQPSYYQTIKDKAFLRQAEKQASKLDLLHNLLSDHDPLLLASYSAVLKDQGNCPLIYYMRRIYN